MSRARLSRDADFISFLTSIHPSIYLYVCMCTLQIMCVCLIICLFSCFLYNVNNKNILQRSSVRSFVTTHNNSICNDDT